MNKRVLILLVSIVFGLLLVTAVLAGGLMPNGDFHDDSWWWFGSWIANRKYTERWPTSGRGDPPNGAAMISWWDSDPSGEPSFFDSSPLTLQTSTTYTMTWWARKYYLAPSECPGGTYQPIMVRVYDKNEPGTFADPSAYVYSDTHWYEDYDLWVQMGPINFTTWVTPGYEWSLGFGGRYCVYWMIDDIDVYTATEPMPTPTPTTAPPPFIDCGLENYSFDDELDGWSYGDWVTWNEDGYVELHECVDQLDSYISQPITLTATGLSEHYELSISARAPFPVAAGSEPLVRWKLNSLVPGDDPDWYNGQIHVFFDEWWQHNSAYLRESNSEALTDTLTIWTTNNDVQIDNVCITLHSGPATMTPVCPISPTYTALPTYTPLATPSPVNTATATAWAATATAWATQEPYPTQVPPNCDAGTPSTPDFSFIWLMAQLLLFLGAFFEAIFRLLGTLLQPIFDLFGFLLWLIGATFSLVADLIDLIAAALQFLFSFVGLFFDILEIIGAFIRALWDLLTMAPTDPGVEIPTYFSWGIAVYDFLIEGTPLEYLEIIAFAVGSIAIIIWTVKQFSNWS